MFVSLDVQKSKEVDEVQEIFKTQFQVRVHHEDGSYWAEVMEMPGCFVSGDSIEEIREALAEAIGLYLSSENVKIDVQQVELTGPLQVEDHDHDGERYELAIPA